MAYLAVAVAIVGAITLINLLFTLGVIRRLREHEATIAVLDDGKSLVVRGLPGEPVLEFAAVATTGEKISRADLLPDTAVAMLSPTCQPCKDVLADFVPYASSLPRERVLVVVYGTAEETAELVAEVESIGRVIVEQHDGQVSKAFRNKIYPSTFVVDGYGRISASGFDVDALQTVLPVPMRRIAVASA